MELFDGLCENWRVIFRKYKDELKSAIPADNFVPQLADIFKAFKLTDPATLKCVIIGQDPYPDDPTGLAFSASYMTGSLKNIHRCLQRWNLTGPNPSPDLTQWAKRGILLLNSALTIGCDKSSHLAKWEPFIRGILQSIDSTNLPIILFGSKAANFATLFNKSPVYKWGHPSPKALDNNDNNNPKSFYNCDIFCKIAVDWSMDNIQRIYTDGGCRNNGKQNCTSSWAFIVQGVGLQPKYQASGITPGDIQSNNRGELTAILKALDYIEANPGSYVIVSDSEYSIKSVTIWGDKPNSSTGPRKNFDLISVAYNRYKKLGQSISVKHVRSHQKAPPQDTPEYIDWYYNNLVDEECQNVFE